MPMPRQELPEAPLPAPPTWPRVPDVTGRGRDTERAEAKRASAQAAKTERREARAEAKATRLEAKEAAQAEKQRADKQARLDKEAREQTRQEAKEAAQAEKQRAEEQARLDKEAREQERLEAKAAKREKRSAALVPVLHGVESIKSSAALQLLEQHKSSDETVEAVVIGYNDGQVLVGLGQRLLVIKVGFFAGATGGGRVSSYPYTDVVGIQTNTGFVNGALVVQVAGVNTTPGDFWASSRPGQAGRNDDPFKLPNVVPITKRTLTVHALDLERVRTLIREARGTSQANNSAPPPPVAAAADAGPDGADISQQLRTLADLHSSGALSDAEFEAAKRRVIGH